ncbi:MAG: hypothetical protein LBR91_00800 [Puniceicoccales bacterium]|jgi:hypothetical protein|nr:hypothetical protein [Puniceicoccales bacterium]
MTDDEKSVVDAKWFLLDVIVTGENQVYPGVLPEYLPAMIRGGYPPKAIELDLTKRLNF